MRRGTSNNNRCKTTTHMRLRRFHFEDQSKLPEIEGAAGNSLESQPSKIDKDCAICLNIMVEPCKLLCGHRFCFKCLEKAFVNGV